MRFLGSWEELCSYHRIKVKSRIHYRFVDYKIHDFIFQFKSLEETFGYFSKYMNKRLLF